MPCPYGIAVPLRLQRYGYAGMHLGMRATGVAGIVAPVSPIHHSVLPWGPRARRSIRLADHDYRQAGAYFVTICARTRAPRFGDIVSGTVRLRRAGQIAQELWLEIPGHFSNVQLDEFVIMPDHMHGVLILLPQLDLRARPRRFADSVPRSLSTIVGAYKAEVTKRVNALGSAGGESVWQRNFYEHIIRSPRALQRIRTYIRDNPLRWTPK